MVQTLSPKTNTDAENGRMYTHLTPEPTLTSGLQGTHDHQRVFLHPGTRRAFDEKTFSVYIQRSFEKATTCPLGTQKLRRIFATGATVPPLLGLPATVGRMPRNLPAGGYCGLSRFWAMQGEK